MGTETREERIRKLLNEFEMQIDLGYGMKPFGRFVSSKELEPILEGLRKELHEMEAEKNVQATVVKDTPDATNKP